MAENLPVPDNGLDPHFVAGIFVKQYYAILEKSPGIVHKFYTDQSVIDRPGPDGEMTSVTTMQDISQTIMSSDYKGCLAKILNADAQESLDGGVIVAVNGYFIGKDSLRKSFYQTFFLARQERGFFVLNDMLRFMDAHGTFTPAAGSETEKSSLNVHLNHTPVDIAGHPEPTDDSKKLSDVKDSQSSNAPIQNELKDSQSSGAPIQNEVKDSQSSGAPIQNEVKDSQSSDAPIQNEVKDSQSSDAPIQNEVKDSQSSDAPIQNEVKVSQSSDAPIQNEVKDSQSSDAPIQNEVATMKTSYASMVAKQIKVTSPTRTSASVVVRVAPTADQHPKASPILKIPLVPSDSAIKDFNSSNNSTENSIFNGDDVATRTVYVGNLPSNFTKPGLLNAVKVFGRVRQGSMQLRTYDDGFCFGFVEFESAASAQKAIAARTIPIGKYEAYITYKKSSGRSSDNNGGFRAGHFKGQDSGDWGTQGYHQSDTGHNVGGFSRLNGHGNPSGGFGRESYRRNYQRNDAGWSSGEGYQRNNQRRFGSTTRSFGSD